MAHKDTHNPGGGGQSGSDTTYKVVATSLLRGGRLSTESQWNSRRPDNGVGRPNKWEYRDNNGNVVQKGNSAKKIEYFGRLVDIKVEAV